MVNFTSRVSHGDKTNINYFYNIYFTTIWRTKILKFGWDKVENYKHSLSNGWRIFKSARM